ncbi:MAG TPA: hypothetical protein VIK18_05895 [Pirellulales bacterium]
MQSPGPPPSRLFSRSGARSLRLAIGCAGLLLALAATVEAEPAIPTVAELDREPLIERAIMLRLARTPDHHVRFSDSGAASSNVDYEQQAADHWFIENQRYGADLVEAGLIAGNPEVSQLGWKILDWGFARQQPNGGFGDTGDPFHSTSFFVEAAARAVLCARQAGDRNAQQLAARYAPKIAAAAHWMLRPDVLKRGLKNNQPYTHRRWLVAAAWGLAGEVTGEAELSRAAADMARDGLKLQLADGVNPEKAGYDVSYQAVGLLMAARYYTVCRDRALRDQVRGMLSRGLDWEVGKIDAAGEVSLAGSTRITSESGRSGAAKTLDTKAIVMALANGTQITGRSKFKDAALHVARHVRWIKD